MARYQYTGPGPVEVISGELIRPGDVRDLSEEPDWGPWECLDPEPEPVTPGTGPAPAQAAADGGQLTVTPFAAPKGT